MEFHIHHVVSPTFDSKSESNTITKYAGTVRANSLQDAFIKSQCIDGNENQWNTRSTSVGDYIQSPIGVYRVEPISFSLVSAWIENM